MAEPWNGSWNGMPRNPSAIRAIAAIRRAICAGHAIGAGEQASRNAPLAKVFLMATDTRSGGAGGSLR